jgi:threonine synthase
MFARAAAFIRGLPDHSVLDRLVRGRAWIPVLGVLLAGIVAMQVEVLKLGASMGRAIERTSDLTSQNEVLRATVASLADDQRIERLAARMGMVMPAPDSVRFLQAQPEQNAARAVSNIHAPDASAFLAQLGSVTATPTSGASVAGQLPQATGQTTTATADTTTSTTGGG